LQVRKCRKFLDICKFLCAENEAKMTVGMIVSERNMLKPANHDLWFWTRSLSHVNFIHMTKRKKTKRAGYHHGNLRAALIGVARRLIVDRGPHGFSLVEAAALAGVSPAAPYRHFANREALLVEVARSGFERFADELEQAWKGGEPDQLSAFRRMGEAYLTFAHYEKASYIAMFEAGLKGDEFDGLKEASQRAFAILINAAAALGGRLPDGRPIQPEMLGAHIWALSHGMATLFAASGQGLGKPVAGDMKALFDSGMMIYLKGLGIEVSSLNKEN
jgi:AcrR family transcriptional regulator